MNQPHLLPRVLFLCTGNSCRSQMAEGWARTILPTEVEPFSAGIEAHGLNPRAVAVMAEAGVDITEQTSKTLSELGNEEFDLVVTVCGHADEHCPVCLQGQQKVHVGFDDPPRLAAEAKTEEEALQHYRRVRDEIRDWMPKLAQILESAGGAS